VVIPVLPDPVDQPLGRHLVTRDDQAGEPFGPDDPVQQQFFEGLGVQHSWASTRRHPTLVDPVGFQQVTVDTNYQTTTGWVQLLGSADSTARILPFGRSI
jgi:hypothetical protein